MTDTQPFKPVPALANARSSVAAVSGQIRVEPLGGDHWTEARIGLGPWAARLVLEANMGTFRLESQIPGVTDTSDLEEALRDIPFQSPAATYEVAPGARVVTLSYARPLAGLDPAAVRETAIMLAVATSTAAYHLWNVLSPMEVARLAQLGIPTPEALPTGYDQMLAAEPIPAHEWDQRLAPKDAAPAAEPKLPVGVADGIQGPLGSEWDSTVAEIKSTVDEFATTMLVEVSRTARDDEVYIQLSNEGDHLYAEAISNNFLEGASRLNVSDMRRLAHLGWSAPSGDDAPNWFRTYAADDCQVVAEHMARTLRDAYGADPEADGWLIQWADSSAGANRPIPVPPVPEKPPPVKKASAKRASAKKAPAAPEAEGDPIGDYLESIRATRVQAGSDGSTHFVVDDIPGVVRLSGGREIRVSHLVATEVDEERARRFAKRHPLVDRRGLVHLGGVTGKKSLLLTFQGEVDERGFGDPSMATAVRALRVAWEKPGRGLSNLLREAAGSGLVVPHLGAVGPGEIDTFGPWHWGSRYLDPMRGMYLFESQTVVDHLRRHGHMFALAHAGHGVNSYGLNLIASAGDVAAFVQHLWGGAYSDPLADLRAINATYARLHVLMKEAAKVERPRPRWLISLSTFRGTCALQDLDATRGPAEPERFGREEELFTAVAERLPGCHFGSVSW